MNGETQGSRGSYLEGQQEKGNRRQEASWTSK